VMDAQVQKIFVREVERQARFALIAAHDLDRALTAGDMDRLWYSIQGLLVSVGNVSKLLWPSANHAPRGETLRKLLGVPNDSALAPRTFRNHFEHFDERLESWATSSARRNFVDSNVGPPGMIVGLDDEDFLRNFDTQSHAVTFRGDRYLFPPILEAVEKVHRSAAEVWGAA
jgi:hypothetical protein